MASKRTSILCCSLCIPISSSEFAVKSHSSHLKFLGTSSSSVWSGEMDFFYAACFSINRLGGSPFSLTRCSWKESRASRFFCFFFSSFSFQLEMVLEAKVGQKKELASGILEVHFNVVVVLSLLCFSIKEHSTPCITFSFQNWRREGSAYARVTSGITLSTIVI